MNAILFYLAFSDLPHLDGGIIDEQETAVGRLNDLVTEMDRRYSVLKANKVTNIFDLLRKPEATERPPILWVIHDEFAEWMMTETSMKCELHLFAVEDTKAEFFDG